MHDIEPFFRWRDQYVSSEDKKSPFYKKEYSEFVFSNKIYNYHIHPQWDHFGSNTLYSKVLYVDYDERFALLEFIGEWNDCLYNDIMYLRSNLVDTMLKEGINKFVFYCDNVLNFHGSDDSYYEDLFDEIKESGGWVAMINTFKHVEEELLRTKLHFYVNFGERFSDLNWRGKTPKTAFQEIEFLLNQQPKRLTY